MNTEPSAIMYRFPEYGEIIAKKMKENDEFESLCSEYEICIAMLRKMDEESQLRHGKLQEYLEIKAELEEEVLKYLS